MSLDIPTPLSADMATHAAEAAAFLKSLGNPGRLMILCMLTEGEKSVATLEGQLRAKQPNVSQQLARLRMEGLVEARREGRMMLYSLADDRVRSILESLYKAFCAR